MSLRSRVPGCPQDCEDVQAGVRYEGHWGGLGPQLQYLVKPVYVLGRWGDAPSP